MIKSKSYLSRVLLSSHSNVIQRYSSTKDENEEKEKELKRIAENASIDDPPTTCCGRGCANCVYIAWAEALAAKLEAGPELVETILKKVEDPSLKAFIEMELRLKGLKKKG